MFLCLYCSVNVYSIYYSCKSEKNTVYTMWYAALIRFIRRRLVLGIIFASSLTYCIVSFLREGSNRNIMYQDISIERKPFVWRTLQEHNDTNDGIMCRNSVQGKMLLVDDRGYVCQRTDVMKNGCCDPDSDHTSRYSCQTCKENNCCVIYEYCVACCLDPSKRDMLEMVLSKLSAEENVLFRSLTDDYELCLTKCRTSSHSVLHENSYKDPANKHCFGDERPRSRTPD
ncbi:SREBP regulating gene protein isoform X1 [Plodia interpunctella]|uniref:SREBP regulating gene protein isoform X1 n=1 Tax=Plodia interpunctella TaxID=58824 RepID=UPI002367DD25|nr:SREBP regulating gene protein isoform X1 [Plodia interpunctella]